jgi:CubicO group peptidase (beta-lactamase class C family)
MGRSFVFQPRHLIRAAVFAMLAATLQPDAAGAADVTFPDTAPGSHAREWFAANAAGEEAMRAFWARHGDAASLAKRPVDARIEAWKRVRGQLGVAVPLAVTKAESNFIEVRARDGGGQEVFISFDCADTPPYGLLGIGIEPAGEPGGPGGPGGGGPGGAGGPGGPGARGPEEAPAGPPPSDREIVASLAGLLDSLARADQFSGAALLMKGDSVLFQHAYGMASRERHEPNALDTRFNLGSINKIFTTVAIQQLAEVGKLAIDSTIDHYLPDYPKDQASKITIRQLLDHRGGVPDVFGARYQQIGAANIKSMADWYALIRDLPLRFEPGTRQQYSNGGFVLLGEIIEHVSGEPYYDYVRRHIYEPAGMTRTGHLMSGASEPARATAYTRESDGAAPTAAEMPGRGSSAGGGYSTVGDLVRFAHALRAGKLLKGTHAPRLTGTGASLGIAGGSPGVNGLLQLEGPYVLAILANTDPPAAEQFMETTGRSILRATGGGQGGVRVGGGH